MDAKKSANLIICTVLVLGTAAVYWPVHGYDFVNFDDPAYITLNQYVRAGLTLSGLKWALLHSYDSNWHPLTWLSHMTDVQLFGMNPGAFHAVNVAFHIANTLLLFAIFAAMSRALWR